MQIILKFALLASTAIIVFMADMTPQWSRLPQGLQLISEADAVWGRQRRTRRRGVAVGYAAGTASGAAAASAAASTSQQQSTTAQQQTTTAQQQPATTQQAGALPVGTVVSTLPAGCTPTQVGGVQYQHCGADYYRAAFQGNNLVYVTAQPK